jgi:MFS family permease
MALTGLTLLVIVLIRDGGGSPTLVGGVNSIGAAGGLVGAFLSARVARRFRGRTVVLVSGWLIVAVMAGIAAVRAPWQVGLLLALLLITIGPMNVIFSTYETRMIPDALSARVSNAIDFGSSLLRAFGPALAGVLAAGLGPRIALLLLAIPVAALAASAHVVTGLHALNVPIDEIVAEESVEVS